MMGDEYVLAWEMVMWMVIGVDSLRGEELVGMGRGSMEWEIGPGLGVGVSGNARGGIWSVYVLAPSEVAPNRADVKDGGELFDRRHFRAEGGKRRSWGRVGEGDDEFLCCCRGRVGGGGCGHDGFVGKELDGAGNAFGAG